MIGLYIWAILILIIIGLGFYYIRRSLLIAFKNTINRDISGSVDIHKEGYNRSKFPIIKAKIRGKYKYFLVDTGANVNILDYNLYQELVNGEIIYSSNTKIKITGPGTAGEPEDVSIVTEDVTIKDITIKIEFALNKAWEEARKQVSNSSGLPIIGILGSEFCNDSKWMIDFDNLIIWVKK